MPTVAEQVHAIIAKHMDAAVAEAIEAYRASLDEGIGTAPKGPGRPSKALLSATAPAATPKRRGRPPGSKTKPTVLSSESESAAAKPTAPKSAQPSAAVATEIDRILELLKSNPSQTAESIMNALGAKRGVRRTSVKAGLALLRKMNTVSTSGQRRAMTYTIA